MKKKNIAMIMTMAMITSGVTAPMEAVYASDEIQIQSEDVFESENEDALGESTDVTEATEDSFAESTESEATDMSEAEEVETTEDAEQSGDEEIEISEEDSDTEENVADVFSDGAEDVATHSSSEVVEGGSTDAGNAVYRLYADGTLVIDGQGAFISSKFRDDSRIKSIRVSEGVTDLGGTYSYAFWGCENLTTVSLPESLESIGEMTFYECKNLSTINIPAGVTSIGNSAFQSCKALRNITIPDGVASIERYTFYDCSSLSDVNISAESKLTSIEQYSFEGCKSLESINIPSGVTGIGE